MSNGYFSRVDNKLNAKPTCNKVFCVSKLCQIDSQLQLSFFLNFNFKGYHRLQQSVMLPIVTCTHSQLTLATVDRKTLRKAEVVSGRESLVALLNLGPWVRLFVESNLPPLVCFCGWRVTAAGIVACEQTEEHV